MNNSRAGCSAFDKAVNLLAFKDRTKKEIYDKLKEKGYSIDEIDIAVCKLCEYGYINDERYALSYIKANIGKKGKKLIKTELINKGVDRDVVAVSLEEVFVDEYETIDSIILRRYSDVDFKDEKIRRRVFGYLQRRGFDYGSISAAIGKYVNNIM